MLKKFFSGIIANRRENILFSKRYENWLKVSLLEHLSSVCHQPNHWIAHNIPKVINIVGSQMAGGVFRVTFGQTVSVEASSWY